VAQYAREVGDWRLYVEEEQCRRLPDFATWQGQGIIAAFDDERVARAVERSGLPVVAVGGGGGFYNPASGIPYVDTDNGGIAALAAEHLLDRGLASFAYYGLPPVPAVIWSEARAAAFSRRLAEAGYACATLAARHDATQWAALQHELGEWLLALPKPVGVMACDDVRARHILEACASVGLRVPHEVAVIGVDDDEFVCELSDPPLSSIVQAARGVGIEAARMLDRLMRRCDAAANGSGLDGAGAHVPLSAGSRGVPPRVVVPPAGVVARRSTDTLAVADPVIAAVIRRIRDDACRGLTITELVGAAGLSRWVLEKRFRTAVGHSIHDDLVRTRLGEARRLVTSTDLPLKQVAPRAGFRSVAYMTTLFRHHLGTTPAALRRSSRASRRPSGSPARHGEHQP
jgi:LacI family transcriptional regulator